MFAGVLPKFLCLYYFLSVLILLLLLFLISLLFNIIIGKTDRKLIWVNIRSQILSLGLAILFFSGVFTNLIKGVFTILNEVFFQIPQTIILQWTNILGAECLSNPQLSSDCINQVWAAFVSIYSTSLSNAFDFLGTSSISYTKLVMMLVFWIAFSLLFTPYFIYRELPEEEKQKREEEYNQNEGKPGKKIPLLQVFIMKIEQDKRNKLTFYSVLTLGVYLSIAAIVAIPVLEEPPELSESISAESLKQQLTSALTLSDLLVKNVLTLDPPFQALELYLEQPHEQSLSEIQAELEKNKADYENYLDQYSNFYNTIYAPMKDFLNSSVSAYRVNSSIRKGKQESSNHFLLIDTWYRDLLSSQTNRMVACQYAIAAYQQNRMDWANDTLGDLENEEQKLLDDQAKMTESAVKSFTPTATATPSATILFTKTNTETPTLMVLESTMAQTTTTKIALELTTTPSPSFTETIANTPTLPITETPTVEITPTAFPTLTRTLTVTSAALIDLEKNTLTQLMNTIDKNCTGEFNEKYFEASIPSRPDLGENLGPFTFVASWLMNTESLSLAQIVGMLGFGLLGAAVGNLIKNKGKLDEIEEQNNKATKGSATTPKYLCSSVTLVIIRGASAALVVFLAVKGGLTILNVAENDPNSYMLFLICLVAAVYSEKIWKYVETKISDSTKAESPETRKPKR